MSKVYRVIQDDVRNKEIERIESYVLAESLVDVAKDYERDEPELDHILVAIIEQGTVVRNIKCPDDAYRNQFDEQIDYSDQEQINDCAKSQEDEE